MGLFDGYFDQDQFQDGGGLLGRLLSLQRQQGQYQPGTGFDRAPSVAPASLSMPSPVLPNNLQPSAVPPMGAQDLKSQYAALLPVLGDHNAMIATVNPEMGETLIAQALANQQQSGNLGGATSAGYQQPVISDIQNGQTSLGNAPGETEHIGTNGVKVVTGADGQVITVITVER